MGMNKQTGNMYPWVTHTYNPIKGKCPHDCSYCYMKRFKVGELRLVEKELGTDLGKGNFIFVGSSTDMFAKEVPVEWIARVMLHCKAYENKYLFQSKNPARFWEFRYDFPEKSYLGTTIETNRGYPDSNAPSTEKRFLAMKQLVNSVPKFPLMISIEPVIDFDTDFLVSWIKEIKPAFVSIGADSKGHDLPEPSWEKIKLLIEELKKFTEVKVKPNLKRLQIQKRRITNAKRIC